MASVKRPGRRRPTGFLAARLPCQCEYVDMASHQAVKLFLAGQDGLERRRGARARLKAQPGIER
eukprot:6227716-Pyramimonas_sp.AAC.1